jgi:hypothetical protein
MEGEFTCHGEVSFTLLFKFLRVYDTFGLGTWEFCCGMSRLIPIGNGFLRSLSLPLFLALSWNLGVMAYSLFPSFSHFVFPTLITTSMSVRPLRLYH